MPFIQVDPKAIQFDAPQSQASNGFVKVDPGQIEFDKPITQSPESGGRLDFIKQQWSGAMNGELNPAEAGYNIVGKGIAGGATDAIGRVVSAIIPQAVKDTAGAGAQKIADFIDRHDPQTSDALLGISEAVPVLRKQYPRISNLVDSTADIAGFAPIAKAIPGAVSKATSLVNSIPDIGTKLPGILGDTSSFMSPVSAINIPTLGGASVVRKVGSSIGDVAGAVRGSADILTTPQLQDIAKRGFDVADQSGGVLVPQAANSLIDRVASNSFQTAEGKAFAGDDIVTKTANDFSSLRDKPLTLAGSMEIDKSLGDRIVAARRAGNMEAASQLQGMQRDFRNGLLSAGDSGQLIGGADGVQGWREGQQAWTSAMKMRDLDRISQIASSSDNPAKTIATQARNLLKNPLKAWGYRADEIAALESASRTGLLTDALRIAGSRLGPIAGGVAGFATGGLPGMAAASTADYVASSAARSGATALQNSRLNTVRRLVNNRPEIADMTAAPSGALPPPTPVSLSAVNPADGRLLSSELDSLNALHDNLLSSINSKAELAGKQGGFWRERTLTDAANEARNLANVKQQIADIQSKISAPSSPPTLKQIMQMPPAQAKEALKMLRP